MPTIKFGQATNSIFNVSRTKYGEKRVYVPPHGYASAASGWSPTGYLHPSGNFKEIVKENASRSSKKRNSAVSRYGSLSTLIYAFLSEMHTLPFLDALLLGPRKPVSRGRSTIPLPDGLYTFWRRDQQARTANGSEECEKAFTAYLKSLQERLIRGFAAGYRMPWDDAPIKTNCLGVTHLGENSEEKAGAQYYLAITMIHELTHAIGFNFFDDPEVKLRYGYEPYFENSPQCELGFEMENSVFGGIIEPVFKAPAALLAYWMASSYPCWFHMHIRTPETMVLDLVAEYNDVLYTYFIPIQTFEDMRKLSFWDTVIRRYGFSADWTDYDEFNAPQLALMKTARFSFHEGKQQARIKELAESVELYNSKQFSPSRKTASKVLDDIMASASKEEKFYDFTQDAADAGQGDKVALLLIPKLEQAVLAHKETFHLLEASEAFRHEKFRDRRATLFRWNVDEIVIATLEQLVQLLAQLEDVRLELFPPLPTWTIGHEYKAEGIEELKKWPENFFAGELAELDFVYLLYTAALEPNLSRCRTLAGNRMQENLGSSPMSFYCRFLCMTQVLVCSDEWMERKWEERYQVIGEKLQWLKFMREGCMELWGSTFEVWMRWYEARRRKVDDEKAAEEMARLSRENSERGRRKRRERF
ncbi:uncharacterized protein EAF01_007705 [Botrytis porri]|uniref:uncharacterized protein n=1 Tax=Botrytis porri TaxID=87229 RepID=UPI0018FFE150|nr:uncharacterized protein EAF01_007705 [Botrytis porri]KAF7900403.1 hypothetical protein EAF01_007705 [Botrytis porri]